MASHNKLDFVKLERHCWSYCRDIFGLKGFRGRRRPSPCQQMLHNTPAWCCPTFGRGAAVNWLPALVSCSGTPVWVSRLDEPESLRSAGVTLKKCLMFNCSQIYVEMTEWVTNIIDFHALISPAVNLIKLWGWESVFLCASSTLN